jgi:hypothetical protein
MADQQDVQVPAHGNGGGNPLNGPVDEGEAKVAPKVVPQVGQEQPALAALSKFLDEGSKDALNVHGNKRFVALVAHHWNEGDHCPAAKVLSVGDYRIPELEEQAMEQLKSNFFRLPMQIGLSGTVGFALFHVDDTPKVD